ncbi:MAG: DNA-binding protein [Betaproteobacteria bacterium]
MTAYSDESSCAYLSAPNVYVSPFPPIELVTSPTVPTAQAAFYLNRKPQTLREWAMTGKVIKPIRCNGRLAWPVHAIRAAMEGKAI